MARHPDAADGTPAELSHLTAKQSGDAVAALLALRAAALAEDGVEERIHRTEVSWAVERVFCSAYLKSSWLEIGISLRREASHPELRSVFPTSKTVFLHRLRVRDAAGLDGPMLALVREAARTVGAGR